MNRIDKLAMSPEYFIGGDCVFVLAGRQEAADKSMEPNLPHALSISFDDVND
ncbi:hypothetical protein [Rubritalea marina]|uniref:hypothetical protein n=1 Tax=Rubritalea marina TaxID=361055 RepID=UPI000376E0FC|nr:hypothetical protein [Rubritalea marina]